MFKYIFPVLLAFSVSCSRPDSPASKGDGRPPNILIAIADDVTWIHTSAYGYPGVNTPALDRVAREGVLFNNAFAASPGCSPARAALLTGRHTWQIEEAGTHNSAFPAKYVVFPDLLEAEGYFIGSTRKGWGPGNWKISGRTRPPAGPDFSELRLDPPNEGIDGNDYAGNFEAFLDQRPDGRPFYFWYGGYEPHRPFEQGAGLRAGKRLEDVIVPPFLPDTPEVRSDILDYLDEIEWFDRHLGRMLRILEESGELENTIVIVTGDNGMAFPRAKANVYEYGIHVPLAIRWDGRVPPGRVVDDVVGFVDLTATILEVAGAARPDEHPISGKSIVDILTSTEQGLIDPERVAWSARERHGASRPENLSYPQRALRTPEFLYIRNFRPDRWPAGDPQKYERDGTLGPMHGAYQDIDRSPTLDVLIERRNDPRIRPFFLLAVDKRPAEELFDIVKDPGCLHNLAEDPKFAGVRQRLAGQMDNYLRETGDPRLIDGGEIWETYPRHAGIYEFPASPSELPR